MRQRRYMPEKWSNRWAEADSFDHGHQNAGYWTATTDIIRELTARVWGLGPSNSFRLPLQTSVAGTGPARTRTRIRPGGRLTRPRLLH